MCRYRTCKIYQVVFVFLESSHIYRHRSPPPTRNPSSSVIRLREKLLLLSSPRPWLHIFKPFSPSPPSLPFAPCYFISECTCVICYYFYRPVCNDFRREISHKTRDLLFLCSLRDYISFRLGGGAR